MVDYSYPPSIRGVENICQNEGEVYQVDCNAAMARDR